MDRFWNYKIDHVIFWAATIGFHMSTKVALIHRAGVQHFILESIVRNGLLALLIYFNLLVLIPRLAQKGRIYGYISLLALSLAAYVVLKNAHDLYLYGHVLGEPAQSFLTNTYYNFSIAFFYLAFSVALHFSKAWYFQRELLRKMEIEKLNAELDYLKAQINPHFVFNSINSIYFQIDRQNETARSSLSSFSEMLRYQLYECNGVEIPIEKEINYIKNYIALQQIRKDDSYKILVTEGDGLKGFTICPLLLIPFVENAFKHVSNLPAGNRIAISLDREGEFFIMKVFNTREEKQMSGAHAGIGLGNVTRRLELLYKDKHTLSIDSQRDAYEVKLALRIGANNNPDKSA